MQNQVHAHIRDIAYLMGRSVATIQSDWKKRVANHQIPQPLTGFKHPTWHRQELIDWLSGQRPPRPTRSSGGTNRPSNLGGLMSSDQP